MKTMRLLCGVVGLGLIHRLGGEQFEPELS